MLPQLTPRRKRVAASAASAAAADSTSMRGKRPHPSAYYIRDMGARPPVVPRETAIAPPPLLGGGGGRAPPQPQPPIGTICHHLKGGAGEGELGVSARGGSIAPPAGSITDASSGSYVGAGLQGVRKQVAAELARLQRECDGLNPDDTAVLEIHRDSFSRLIGR
jgi:hypothetical protein